MKVGVVGFGYWGPHLVRNFKSLLEIDDVVVCDQSKGRVQAARNLYPGISTFFDFSEMLGTAKLDAVAIATPSHTHYELVKQALRSGLHVLVEKPITTDSKEAAELDEIARENGLVLMVDHTFLYSDSVTFMKKAIDDGRIGRVRSIDSVRVNLGIFQPDVSVAWDLAIHDLAIICHLLGEVPNRVSGTGSTHTSSKHPSTSYITLFFASGAVSHIHVSWTSPLKVRRIMVEGDTGSFVFDDTLPDEKVKIYDAQVDSNSSEAGTSLLLNYRLGDVTSPRLQGKETLRTELSQFIGSIQNKTPPLSSSASAVPLICVLEAIDISISRDGASVDVKYFV
jgi:predicted dehydrogenase